MHYLFDYRDTRDPIATLAAVTEKRWVRIQDKLEFLQSQIHKISQNRGLKLASKPTPKSLNKFQDIVIEMDPDFICKGIAYLASKLASVTSVYFACHSHSSLLKRNPMDFWPESDPNKSRLQHKVALTLIWKPVGLDPILKPNSTSQPILGEVNIYRYFSRLFGIFDYENCHVNWIDAQLDGLHAILHGSQAKNCIALQRPPNLPKNVITVADVAFASLCFRVKEIKSLSANFAPVPELK